MSSTSLRHLLKAETTILADFALPKYFPIEIKASKVHLHVPLGISLPWMDTFLTNIGHFLPVTGMVTTNHTPNYLGVTAEAFRVASNCDELVIVKVPLTEGKVYVE